MGEGEESEADRDYLTTVYYPPVFARRKPAWMSPDSERAHAIPDEIQQLMEELYVALQNGCHRIVAMGARTVLEIIMKSKVGDQKNFNDYLNEFQKAYYISVHQREILDVVLNAGNAAAHRAWKGDDNRLATIMEITERWVEMVFLHQPLAKELEAGVPPRPPRPDPEVSRRRKQPP